METTPTPQPTPPSEEPPQSTRQQVVASLQQPLVQYLLLFLVVLCVYVPTFWYTYVWDDWGAIAKNTSIREWENIPSFFTDPNTFMHDPKEETINAWRPVRNIYYLITFKLHGLHPAGWHFHHVLIHCLLSTLLLVFFHRLYRFAMALPADQLLPIHVPIAAWLAVFAWAVHPANTEVTAWLKSADDILACLFGIGALIILFPPRHQVTYARAIWAAILYAIALLAKESIPPLALIYPILVVVLAPRRTAAFRNPAFLLAATLLICETIAFVLVRTALLGKMEQSPYMAGSFSLMMATMATAVVRYLQLTFWPFWPTVQIGDYKGWPLAQSWSDSQVLISIAILVVFFIAVALVARRSRIFLAGWLFAGLAFIPVANIVPMMQVMAERFMYFPLIGVALAVTAAYVWWLRGPRITRRIWLPIGIAAALIITTLMRLPVWLDSFSFQEQNAKAVPENYRAAFNYGVTLYKEGRTTEAITYMQRSMKQMPQLDTGIGIAVILSETNRTTEAINQLNDLTKLFPDAPLPYATKGNIYRFSGQTTMALAMYKEAIRRDPDEAVLFYMEALTHSLNGDSQAAIHSLNQSLQHDPSFTSATVLLEEIRTD